MSEHELARLSSELHEERTARKIITHLAIQLNAPCCDAAERNCVPEMLTYLGQTLDLERITIIRLDGPRPRLLYEWSGFRKAYLDADLEMLGRLTESEIESLLKRPGFSLYLDKASDKEQAPPLLIDWIHAWGMNTNALLYFVPPRENACMVAFQGRNGNPIPDHRRELLRTIVDILLPYHRRIKADQELRESERFLKMAQAAAGLTCWEIRVGKYKKTFGDCFETVGRATEGIQVISWDRAFEQYAPPYDERVRAVVEDAWKNDDPFVLEAMLLDDAGVERWVEVRAQAKIGEGDEARMYGTTQDIDARKKIERKLRDVNAKLDDMARRDALTGLLNKREFAKDIQNLCTVFERIKRPLSLIMLDIDHFKAYNDHYGHLGGDDCLRQVGEAIASCLLRDANSAYRYGGEEFAVILPDTNPEGAARVAEKIRAAIQKLGVPHVKSSVCDVVTSSIGFATADAADGASFKPNNLIARADAALYRAKKAGRNRVES